MPCVKAGPHTRNGKEIRRVILIMDFYDLISAVGICLGGPHSLKGGKKYIREKCR